MNPSETVNTETVDVIRRSQTHGTCWSPVVGAETSELLDHLQFAKNDREVLVREAAAVIAKCAPPTSGSSHETSLVIGYVQSGKTTSFTAVSALARDNGYRLVVIITGITRNLFEQSCARLVRDLRLHDRTDRKWQYLENPKSRPDVRQRITAAVSRKDGLQGEDKTVLICVMKNGTHLGNLIKLLSELPEPGIPSILIDDEADQASLNNLVNKGEESATYRRIVQLRRLLKNHTFLQYTATPQAPLLINLIDDLSPRTATMLTPGPTYTGGKTFFERDLNLIRHIPQNEIPHKDQVFAEPPYSLLQAMRIYFLGVADGILKGEQGNRSMMVHPSKETMQHANYEEWVRDVQRYWCNTLLLSQSDFDRQDLIEEFRTAFTDLRKTAEGLAEFEEIIGVLPRAVNDTIVTKVNASGGSTPQPDWRQDYAHILIGGEVLNRGYTVEGLTVTYMPRSKGVGNSDTIQQRARWFGYKSEYLGYCRVYLTDEQVEIYQSYIEHEETIRRKLAEHLELGKSLQGWKRVFLLSPDLRPTRHDVLDLEYIRGNYSKDWFEQRAPHDSDSAIIANRQITSQFIEGLTLREDTTHLKWTEKQTHLVDLNASLRQTYQALLTQFLMTRPNDSHRFTGLLLQIGRFLDDHEDAVCAVYLMSGGKSRRRKLVNDEIEHLFQGPNPDGMRYPGDRTVFVPNIMTVQIHYLNVQRIEISDEASISDQVPALAVKLPKEMSTHWLVQTDTHASKDFARPNWE